MELTNRRFAIFLASGLTLAVVVGLLVWKVSDAGVSLNGQETEYAGQPVAAADASSQKQTEEESSSAAGMTSSEHAEGNENADMSGGTDAGAGDVNDPLAPPNANLGGGRGGSVETSYYRPTNAAPAPTAAQQQNQQQQAPARTTAPQQTQQPDSAGTSTKPGESPSPSTTTPNGGSTTVVPEKPSEPQRQGAEAQEGGVPPQNQPIPAEPQAAAEELASDAAEKAINAGKDAASAMGIDSGNGESAPKKRPEDPFSASTRVQQAPAEDKAEAQVNATDGAAQADAQPAEASSAQ